MVSVTIPFTLSYSLREDLRLSEDEDGAPGPVPQAVLTVPSIVLFPNIQTALDVPRLFSKISALVAEKSMDISGVSEEIVSLVSAAAEEFLRELVRKLGRCASHRLDTFKDDSNYVKDQDVRAQIRFLKEAEETHNKCRLEEEREAIKFAASKARAYKSDDEEKLWLREKAKSIRRAEEDMERLNEANYGALLAIGGGKKKPSLMETMLKASQLKDGGNSNGIVKGINSPPHAGPSQRRIATYRLPRVKRVTMRDLFFVFERDRRLCRSSLLFEVYIKPYVIK